MKNFMFALFGVILAGGVGYLVINGSSNSEGSGGFLSNYFGQSSDVDVNTDQNNGTGSDVGTGIAEAFDENLIVCPEGEIAVEDEISGEISCAVAEPVDTQCLGIDGEAYDQGEEELRYAIAYKTEDELNPECETRTFTCTDSEFTAEGENGDDFIRTECVIIDETDEEFVTCEFEEQLFVPGETRYQYIKDTEKADQDCVYIGIFCGGDGERFTNFDLDAYEFLECSFEEQLDTEFMDDNAQELIEMGYLEETEEGEIVQTGLTPGDLINTGAACNTPWGESVEHGEQVLSFRDLVSPFDEECHIMTSQCIDGSWFPERERANIYDHPTCKINPPADCLAGNTTIFHNQTATLYAEGKYVSNERTCPSQERNCRDGTVDGDEEYIYTTCTAPVVNTPKPVTPKPVVPTTSAQPDCPSPYVGGGAKRKPDQTGIGYLESSVGRFNSCESVNLVCKYGTIRIGGVENYGASIGRDYHVTCSKGTPDTCSFNRLDGGTQNIDHTSFVTFYTVPSVPYGSSCQDKLIVDGTQCQDGSFTVIDKGYQNCVEEGPATCSFDYLDVNDASVAHQGTETFYTVASVAYGQSCSDYTKTTTCTNGSLTIQQGYANCVEEGPATCSFNYLDTTDISIPHSGSETFYTRSSVSYEQSCNNYRSTTTCTNGSLSIQEGYKYCEESEPRTCTFDYLDAGDEGLNHNEGITFYSVASVPYGQSCSNYRRNTTCVDGSLSIRNGYMNCYEEQPVSCTSPCGTVPHGGSIQTYASSSVSYNSTCNMINSTCNNGSLSPNAGSACFCEVRQPSNCANGLAHGQTITRYQESGCNANAQGNNLDGGTNSNCVCIHGSVTCTDGNLTQTANYPGDSYPQGQCN